MRRAMLFLLVFCLACVPSLAETYRSEYGYTLVVPEKWSVVSRDYSDEDLMALPDVLGVDMFLNSDRSGLLTVMIYPSDGLGTEELGDLLNTQDLYGAESIDMIGLSDYGDRNWYCLSCDYDSCHVFQASCVVEDRLYLMTFYSIDGSSVIDSILSSFSVTE